MNSLKTILTILILILIGNHTKAQITINGNVKNTDLNPVSNALVEISIEEDKSELYTTYTDPNGNFSISNIYVDVNDEKSGIPDGNIILRNYPNPFNPSTIIYYELPESEEIEIKIYDILGREIRALLSDFQKEGSHRIVWDGQSNFGSTVAAGIYLCRLKTKDNLRVHKMVLLDGGSNTAPATNIALQKSKQNKIVKQTGIFSFTIKVSEKYINPIELRNISCSGDTTLELVATKPLINVIGPEGGILSNDEFYLNIPASGFTTNEELRLYTIPGQNSPIEKIVSKTYRLEGIPKDYNQSLSVGLKYEGELQNESTVEFGVFNFIPELGDSIIIYLPMAARDSAGFLWASSPDLGMARSYEVQNKNTKNKSIDIRNNIDNRDIYIKANSNKKLIGTENFDGYLPEYVWNIPILNHLEISYNQLKIWDLAFSRIILL